MTWARLVSASSFLLVAVVLGITTDAVASGEDREVIAMFRPGTLILPAGSDSGTVDEATIPIIELENGLTSLGIEMITKAFPGFNLADTLEVTAEGDTLRLTNWGNVFVLRLPVGASTGAAAATLEASGTVAYAEPNGVASFTTYAYPNDTHFKDGQQWNLWNYGQNGTADQDVDGPEAWGIEKGLTYFKIAVIDAGVRTTHEDLQGRVEGDFGTEHDGHGTQVAGIIGANTDNALGIAGMDWNTPIVSKAISTSELNVQQAISSALSSGARVFNCSWVWTDGKHTPDTVAVYSKTIRLALADVYKRGYVTVAAMGNTNTGTTQYPAGFGQGIIAVGASTSAGQRWSGSNLGDHIDFVAPGENVFTTGGLADDEYVVNTGTSFAVPQVSGIAALLMSENSSVNCDDVENLLRISADDIAPPGKDPATGWGRVNAHRALQLIRQPNDFRNLITGFNAGQLYSTSGDLSVQFYGVLGLKDGAVYVARRREIRQTITFPAFTAPLQIWGTTQGGTYGFSPENPNYGLNWCEPVAGTTYADQVTMRTYVYEVYHDAFGNPGPIGGTGITAHLYPNDSSPPNGSNLYRVGYAFRALGIAPTPDQSRSYYVPEAVVSGVVKDGLSTPKSYQFFRGCPNNDGASYPGSARIKVVVKDAAGSGIPNVPATDIFVLFNGGSPVQGFVGEGTDSVVANSQFGTPTSACPNLRGLIADAPTDANGIAYITFVGAGGTRDSGRKWGHFDSEMPVYVLGTKVSGRLSDASAAGSYTLQIKSADRSGGLSLSALDHGELINSADANTLLFESSPAYGWWSDLDSSGVVNSTDFSILNAHFGHTCSSPNNP